MTRILTYIFLIIGLISCGLTFDKNEKVKSGEIEISWLDSVTGDFSFTKNWDYPESVYKNEFGQLSCDGLCPTEIDRMKDVNGKIYKDSLNAFYQLVDTTHQFHSIQSDAWAYEWAGTNFVTAIRKNVDTTICYTHDNVATHSFLILTITKDKCIPTIELNSVISSVGKKIYTCKTGRIEIDKNFWEKGILKANFNFVFDHTENPNEPMYWKGKIYANIDNK
ncbi:hypothetical protein [Flavobacterium filum]|uniref:hypothetical protein n=1 Tax=Flavobacterium filum TaxID=370974 RepID=UPI0023F10722|nr:hypothetical protein [Flavobacterium filum]